jgi:processive 1,2-diacylglycerol beta-glucosyltransferase
VQILRAHRQRRPQLAGDGRSGVADVPERSESPAQGDDFRQSRPETKKIWLVHGSHTGGHASAAKSLKIALDKYPGVETEIINVAETSDRETPISTAAEVALKGGAWVNSIRRWVFDQQYEGNSLVKWASNQLMSLEAKSQGQFVDRILAEKPDVIVSTMSATNSLLSGLKQDGLVTPPIHAVVTDYASHQMWAQENIAHYYVATDEVRNDLKNFGVDSDRIDVTGIPIKDQFANPSSGAQVARLKLGLDPKKPLVLMLGGSLGYGAFGESLKALDDIPVEFQMAAVTGRNERLQTELNALDTEHDLKVEGYVSDMPTWLEAADLVLTKPGGLTCSEILAKGKPLILQKATSGLEARLVNRLEATGAAVVVDGPKDLREKVQVLLQDGAQRDLLIKRAQEVGKPNSSARIAENILSSL